MTDEKTIHEYVTISGYTHKDAVRKLNERLDDKAYKKIGGRNEKGLIDINPAYMVDVLNEVFGICGLGWGYDYEPTDITSFSEVRKSAQGREYTVHVVSINKLNVWTRWVLDGEVVYGNIVPSNGYSENENFGYALRGAITNALGSALSKMGWQNFVYSGEFNLPEGRNETPSKPQGREKTPKISKEQMLKTALETVVPDGFDLPAEFVGKTFGELQAIVGGENVIKWLTGNVYRSDKTKFTGPYPIKQAAKLVLGNKEQSP